MDKQQASRLAQKIESDDAQVRVTGTRHYDTGYVLDCVDTRTGTRFTVSSWFKWDVRVAESQGYQGVL